MRWSLAAVTVGLAALVAAADPPRAAAAQAPAAAAAAPTAEPATRVDGCVACHGQLDGAYAAPVEGMRRDVHSARGISCSDCHGGNPAEEGMAAMDEAAGFRGKPARGDIPALCGRCHSDVAYMREVRPGLATDQFALYATSVHGRRLAEGDTKVATCVDCHGVHGILAPANAASPVYPTNVAHTCARCHADSAYMADYQIPTNQFADYQRSVHAELLFIRHDLGAPTCNDCHGNHGAYPPGTSSVAAVCGQCHGINRDLFLGSPHKAAFDRLGLPECVACHGKHAIARTTDAMLGVGPVAVCITCHARDSAGYGAAATMGTDLASLNEAVDDAGRALEAAARAGMEMSEARFQLQAAHEALVQSRNLVHAFSAEKLTGEVVKGRDAAATVQRVSAEAFEELARRRRLIVVPLLACVVVLGLLYAKLRDIEPPGKEDQ